VPSGKPLLNISFVGYSDQTVSVQPDNQNIIVRMIPSAAGQLGEVIVVGYGTQKKSQVIGSISQLDGDKINNRATAQVSNALTGQLPGVTVIQRSGQPGASAGNIQIRGVGSFGASTAAFILVDGIPASDFNQIAPNDIASISVLKDASSAAIYGARASNGVILVTTKSGGKDNKLKLSYNGYVGTQKVTTLPQSVNSWEYAQAVNEAAPGSYTQVQIDKFKDGSDPDNYPNSDFYSQFFKPTAVQTGHNLSMSNGNKSNQYVLSFGYINQGGIVKKNLYNRYNPI
jgi:TonB-dependent SusC/RagA subfamily outer membrane receptor